MTDPIATIRDYLHSPLSKPPPQVVAQALAVLEAELTTLRENALDLSRVPEGYGWVLHSLRDGNIMATVGTDALAPNDRGKEYEAIADTPRAALDAAIARAKEHGETK